MKKNVVQVWSVSTRLDMSDTPRREMKVVVN